MRMIFKKIELLLLAAGLFLSHPAFSDISFEESTYMIGVDIQWDSNSNYDNDKFQFSVKKIGADSKPLILNKEHFNRKIFTEKLAHYEKKVSTEKESDAKTKKLIIIEDLKLVLDASLHSKVLILEFSKELLEILQLISPKNSLKVADIVKKLQSDSETTKKVIP